MKWISVKDKMPDPFVEVLCVAINKRGIGFEKNEKYLAVDRFCKWQDDYPDSFRTTRFDLGEITHWMPLPKLPEEE